jgi:dTDP-4-dehydrorhamnose reductase
MYKEEDKPDVSDLYGLSKFLGELHEQNTVTLRTSIIGHEFNTSHGLVEWFLSQENQCKGFSRAIFSGLPTVVLAKLIKDVVIPRNELYGLYHVAAEPISKFDLLNLVARVYSKTIKITPDEELVIDRSLDASRFKEVTGYVAPGWPELINVMHSYQ